VVPRGSRDPDEEAALRQRQDGRPADPDPPRPLRRQHLPIRTIKFIKKDAAIQFEIEVPKDNDILVNGKIVKASEIAKEEEVKKTDQDKEKEKEKLQDTEKNKEKEAEKPKEPEKKTKILAFTYELATGKLALIEDYKEPLKRPRWASVSPDEKTVVFARGHNLFMMDAESFKLAQRRPTTRPSRRAADDRRRGALFLRPGRQRRGQEGAPEGREGPQGLPLAGHRHHLVQGLEEDRPGPPGRAQGRRPLGHQLPGQSRPTLETYRYAMPGEENQPQPELLVFDLATKAKAKIKAESFKDQTIRIQTAPRLALDREREFPPPAQWLSDTTDKLYFVRLSRDLHRVDLCLADTATGEVKVLIEERAQHLHRGPAAAAPWRGKEMVWWSERDGWGHLLSFRRGRQAQGPAHLRRVRRPGDRADRREGPDPLLLGLRPGAGRGPLLHPPLSGRPRRYGPQAAR